MNHMPTRHQINATRLFEYLRADRQNGTKAEAMKQPIERYIEYQRTIDQQSETIRELREALLGLITKHPNGRWYDHPVPLAGTVERAGKLLDALANSVTEAERE